MRIISSLFKITSVLLTIVCTAVFVLMIYMSNIISSGYKVVKGEGLSLEADIPLSVIYDGTDFTYASSQSAVGENFDVELKLFGLVPFAKTSIEIVDEMYVSVLGTPFGMKIYTEGVVVVALSDVDSENGNCNPAGNCGLKIGDTIMSVDGEKVYTNEDVARIIESSEGRNQNIVINRDGKIITLTLTPAKSKSTGLYKAGIWVRDSSAGIGTLTFYSPINNIICGLGHGVTDADTGKLLPLSTGEIVGAEIVSYAKSSKGAPGELNGRITTVKYGELVLNSEKGVYGTLSGNVDKSNMIKIALKQEIGDGDAYIITTISGQTPKMYTCEIKRYQSGDKNYQNMIIKITDTELLSATGGILQGMSGSPIIQNGKLIGAVTHVLVDDPTKGYAIFAENMLETAQIVAEEQKLKEAS